ncbi:aminoglycoside 3'-phosphotransferase [Thermobifida halotolerans]|uniref:Aminoglycoside 3'-phosphotransferase n=1 Tax=Thermobifida halotolerans TaxID=483545 RepID=A0AA97LZN9_9ACTN|nr:aminoglycoside 3'-phosphotransferase [Thermobifida halotolerans]UOE21003.1 aminoglycoside 3'-phosphotransferase [Thermobifida halotolerans]
MSRRPTAHIPTGPVPLPPSVAAHTDGGAAHPVWRNELGGLTFRVDHPRGRRFVKWVPAASGLDLAAEAERLTWAAAFTPVPRVLGHGVDGSGQWLLTAALDATSAVDPRWTAEAATAVRAVGEGLRALHEALPVADCPFTWSVERRVAAARRRGLLDAERARALVEQAPPVDRLVVCHGDACAPNTLVDDSGRWAGHVDMGALGVADRWADIAVAAWSTEWNYGPGWQEALMDAYGVTPDPARLAYYRTLWDST